MPDEHFAGQFRVDRRVTDAAAGDQWQTEQRDPLEGLDGPPLGIPVRLAVGALQQMPGHPFDGVRFDAGRGSPVEPAGLHQVRDHHPARWAAGQHRSGSQHEFHVAGARIFTRVPFAQADMGEQSGHQRGVQPGGVDGLGRVGIPHDAQSDPGRDAA
jgi:hypothetical protein